MTVAEGERVLVTVWIWTVLPLLCLLARMYIKIEVRKAGKGWDDVVAFVAWFVLLGFAIVCTIGVKGAGFGQHITTLTQAQILLCGKLIDAAEVLGAISCSWSKTSFAVTLLRIVNKKLQRWGLWYIIISMNIIMSIDCILLFSRCSNPASTWNYTVISKCFNVNIYIRFFIFSSSYSALCQSALAIYPWLVVWNLNMKRRDKYGAASVLSLGAVGSIFNVVKCVYLEHLGNPDQSFYCARVLIFASLEIGLTLVTASLPTFVPVVRDAISESFRTTQIMTTYEYKKDRDISNTGVFTNIYTDEMAPVARVETDDGSDKSLFGSSQWMGKQSDETINNEIRRAREL